MKLVCNFLCACGTFLYMFVNISVVLLKPEKKIFQTKLSSCFLPLQPQIILLQKVSNVQRCIFFLSG